MDIDDSAIERHWHEHNPVMLGIFRRMEADEPWVLDDSENLGGRLMALGGVLERIDLPSCSDEQRESLFRVLGFLRSGRAFRLFAHLDNQSPGFTERLLRQAEQRLSDENDSETSRIAAQIHVDRFVYLDRFSLLARVFSKERVDQIQQILEEIT